MEEHDIKFSQLAFDFEIISEKQYTLETGLELPKIVEEPDEPVKKSTKRKNKKEIGLNTTLKKSKKTSENKKKDIKIEEKDTKVDKKTLDVKEDSHSEKIAKHEVKIQPAVEIKNSFISAVNEISKNKEKQLKKEIESIDKDFPYIKGTLITNAEIKLYNFMENHLINKDRIRILTKVRLGDLIQVDTRITSNTKLYYKVACKHVDYVIVDRDTFDVICVVELDDYTHENEKVKLVDQFKFAALQSAGIKMYRIKCRIADISQKDLRQIEESILMYYRKPCAICGRDTVVKESRKRSNYGHRFYSCSGYPECKYSLDID